MKRFIITLIMIGTTFGAFAQSKSVERFRNEHTPDLKLFFYKSTLKMYSRINLEAIGGGVDSDFGEMPPLSDLIKGIEKVKFFSYEMANLSNNGQLYAELKKDVMNEDYEELMTARADGANMEVMMKERGGEPEGFVVLIRMEDRISVLDIEGYPNVNNILKFSEFINNSSAVLNWQDAFN